MSPTIRERSRHAGEVIRGVCVVVCACVSATLTLAGIVSADPPRGAVVAWGSNGFGQTNVPAPNSDFVAVAAGESHSLGLKADGAIVAWGANVDGQTNIPAPNSGFVAIAGGGTHSLAIRRVTGDADGDGDVDWADFAPFVDYLLGPSADPQLPGWQFFDVDTDDDADLRDLTAWQNVFTGD